METNNFHAEANVQLSAELATLYSLNKMWLSEVCFLDDELRFIKTLLNRFFLGLMLDDNLNRIQLIKMQLNTIGFVKNKVKNDIQLHQQNLESKINNASNKSPYFLQLEESRIKEEVAELARDFRLIKAGIFALTADLLSNTKKANHVLIN